MVVKSLSDIPGESSKGRRMRRDSQTAKVPSDVVIVGEKTVVRIAKKEAQNPNYILKVDKNNNKVSKVYKGNIKKKYVEEPMITGTATLDMSALLVNDFTKWEIPKVSIVTKLKVINGGVIDEVTTTSIGTKLETTKFSKNRIGIDSTGGLIITKLKEEILIEVYDIEIYHKDRLLGKLKLNIKNTTPINIGEVKFIMDYRLPLDKIVSSNGDVKATYAGNVEGTYPELVEMRGSFNNISSTDIVEVVSVEGRPLKIGTSSNKLTKFGVSSVAKIDSSVIPTGFSLNEIMSKIVVDNYNDPTWYFARGMENNKFILKTSNDIFYEGNVKEDYIGYTAIAPSAAKLDLSKLTISEGNNTAVWTDPQKHDSSASGVRMAFTYGNFFDWQSRLTNNKMIITKIEVTNGKVTEVITGGKLETTKFSKNKIGFSDEGFYVVKLTEDDSPELYGISIYYNDLYLGYFDLTIQNTYYIQDIKEVIFRADNRLPKNHLIYLDGRVKDILTGNDSGTYPELVERKGDFLGLASRNIIDVISVEGRPIKSKENYLGDLISFKKSANNLEDASYIPNNFFLYNLKEHMAISNNNSSPFASGMENNIFMIKDRENGQLYKGNIKEEYVGERYTGRGKIDITNAIENKDYRFLKNSVSPGNIPSLEDSKISLNLISGVLPQSQGFKKANIVDSLKVRVNGGKEEIISGESSYRSNPNYDIIIENPSGNFHINKKRKAKLKNERVEITYLYKDIELGEFTLDITDNSFSFEIIGNDIFDFGTMIQGVDTKIE